MNKTTFAFLFAISTVALACASFGWLQHAVDIGTNPSSDPRGAWTEIGESLAKTYPQHQGAQGEVSVRYKYCFLGVCAAYGATFTKSCTETFEQTTERLGDEAAALLGVTGSGGFDGNFGPPLVGDPNPFEGCYTETVKTCATVGGVTTCRYDSYLNCGLG